MPRKKKDTAPAEPSAVTDQPVQPPVEQPAQTGGTESERLGFFQGYNATHREILLERKRLRYKNDPEYKKKILDKARKRYQDNKTTSKTSEHSRVCPMCQRPLPRVAKTLLMRVDGRTVGVEKSFEVYMFSIGELANRLKRQARTIKAWIRDGIIPESRYRNAVHRRLWTIDQVEMFEKVTKKYKLRPPANYKEIGFVGEIKKEWGKLLPLGIDFNRYSVDNGGSYRRADLEEQESDAA